MCVDPVDFCDTFHARVPQRTAAEQGVLAALRSSPLPSWDGRTTILYGRAAEVVSCGRFGAHGCSESRGRMLCPYGVVVPGMSFS